MNSFATVVCWLTWSIRFAILLVWIACAFGSGQGRVVGVVFVAQVLVVVADSRAAAGSSETLGIL